MTRTCEPSRHATARAGYTLVEVLIVVTILGIVGAVVVPHMLKAGTFGVQAAVRSVMADVMYAQADAMSKQAPRQVIFQPGAESYRLTDGEGQTLPARWKSGQRYTVRFGADARFEGVDIVEADFDGEPTLRFDDLGAPQSGGHIDLRFNGRGYRITVAAFTGRVTVQQQ